MEEDRKVPRAIEWLRLLQEFEVYRSDSYLDAFEATAFAASLVKPAPAFVEAFLERKTHELSTWDEKVRALYGYLLQKRYEEKLNLLHFAFNVFEESSHLPEEVVAQTPFPHEDGVPAYRHFQDPGWVLDPSAF